MNIIYIAKFFSGVVVVYLKRRTVHRRSEEQLGTCHKFPLPQLRLTAASNGKILGKKCFTFTFAVALAALFCSTRNLLENLVVN